MEIGDGKIIVAEEFLDGWIARDEDGPLNYFVEEPHEPSKWHRKWFFGKEWEGEGKRPLLSNLFRSLSYEDGPKRVKIHIHIEE